MVLCCDAMQVEKLIKDLPTVPADCSNGDLSSGNAVNIPAENGTNLRETQSMLLERIASEMNRLKFYIAHAQVFFTHSYITSMKVKQLKELQFLRKLCILFSFLFSMLCQYRPFLSSRTWRRGFKVQVFCWMRA